jgi:hypothetical protein
MAMQSVGQVESVSDFGDDVVDATQARWLAEIKMAEGYFKDYFEKTKKIVNSYRDERGKDSVSTGFSRNKRINLLWSNTQTLKPAVMARKPKPVVSRRSQNNNPIANVAAQTLERCVAYTIDDDEFDYTMFAARDDFLLVSRGVVWPVFTAEKVDQGVDEATGQPLPPKVTKEKIFTDYILWDDFLHSPARTWAEVRWVARKVYMTRDQLVKRFGEEKGKEVSLNYKSKEVTDSLKEEETNVYKQACVYEIWCQDSRKVYWICKDYYQPLDVKDDFIGLEKFFPCPRPAYGVMTNNTTVPVPEYDLYRDQARAIDEYETRIQSLRNAMRVRGFYNSEIEEIERVYREGAENDLIPVDQWAAFAKSGGIQGNVVFMPLGEIIKAVIELSAAIEQEKQRIYEVTGISDIVRGASVATETATAQQLKGQFASLRLEDKRREINRFAKSVIEIIAEIISEHYSTETIVAMADIQLVPPPMMQPDPQTGQMPQRDKLVFPKVYQDEFDQAMELLRNEPLRKFRIEIETDSTIASDETADKQAASEMIAALGQFMKQSLEVASAAPPMVPVVVETMLFMLRKFRVGRSLEAVVEQAGDQLEAMAKQPKQPAPDYEGEKLKLQAAESQQKMQLAQAEMQGKMQIAQTELQGKMQIEKYKVDTEAQSRLQIADTTAKSHVMAAKFSKMQQAGEAEDLDEEGNIMPSQQQLVMQGIAQGLQQMSAAQQQNNMLVAQMLGQFSQTLTQLQMPKRVIRDANGSIAGVETVNASGG